MTPASRRIPLASRGVTLHVIDWGGDGTPLLLLHGLSSSARIWDLAAPLLTGRFRVVAADQRSHGLSDRPADGYGFSDTTADTVALIEASPEGYKELGRFDQPDRSNKNSWPHPVVAGGKLYLRDQDILLCYDVKQP